MLYMTYNTTFQYLLESITNKYGPEWFFQKNPNNSPIFKQGWNLFYVPYILNESEWTYGFLDTCRDFDNSCIIKNLHFRYNQQDCININKCNDTYFDNFRSCLINPNIHGSDQKCSYANIYWPRFIYSETIQIACIILDTKGPYSPPKQDYSYVCYVKNIGLLVNDVPYTVGQSCDTCRNSCVNNLCY